MFIKAADRDADAVLCRTDLYRQKAFRQLCDTSFCAKVDKDLTPVNQKIAKETIQYLFLKQKLPPSRTSFDTWLFFILL